MRLTVPRVEALATVAFLAASAALLPWTPPAAPPDLPTPAGHDFPAHATATTDYTFDVELDTTRHRVVGRGTITFRNRSERTLSEIYLHLYANAFRSDDTVFLSDTRPGGRGSGPVYDYGGIDVHSLAVRQHGGDDLWPRAEPADPRHPEDRTDMRVPLDTPCPPGATLDIDVAWTTDLPSIVERMGYHGTFHMVAQWFPKLARLEPDGTFAHFTFDRLGEFYADFGTYDVTISVPVGFTIGATGSRLEDTTQGDRRIVRHVQSDVHDFAFCAYDEFEELRLEQDGVDLRVLHPPGYDGSAREELAATAFGLRHYGNAYGRYPYPTLTLVHPPEGAWEAGGMEYPTLITTGGAWWRHGHHGATRAVTIHELGHQYFYGLVATNEWKWPFLDEGITTFAEVDALDRGWGNGGAFSLFGAGLRASTVLRHLGLPGGHDDVIAQSAPSFSSGYSYSRLVYARAALAFETLDRVYEGGMRQTLGRYARRHRYGHPGPEQLLEAVRDTLGEEAEEALRTCLFDRGWIDVAVETFSCTPHACSLVVTRRGNVVLPVDVRWIHANGSTTSTRWDARQEQARLTLETRRGLVGAILDPDHRIMLDEDFANNAIGSGSPPNPWRTRGLLTHLAALGFSAVSP